jgi:copper homeostasis protein
VSILVESAVESLDDALAAVEGGADRLELCANLAAGGLTPAPSVVTDVLERVAVPVCVMIRPRGGSFTYSRSELDLMRRDLAAMRELGVDGIVVGVLDDRLAVDTRRMELLVSAADGLPVTFHRAFDRVRDYHDALESLIDLGIERVLTSGGASTALAGVDVLGELVQQAGDALVVIAGGGVRDDNVREIVERSGVREVHARCESDAARIAGIVAALAADVSG